MRRPIRLRTDLRIILTDGVVHSLMVGLGETYLAAFALALGMSPIAAGMIATIPLAIGGLMQLSTTFGVRRLGGYRPWIVTCAALQAASFLPLVLIALIGGPAWMVFTAAIIYWATGMATGPAWNAWMGQLVPGRIRAPYFGVRQGYTQVGVLVGVVVGGVALHHASAAGWQMTAFALLFALAFLCRSASAMLLSSQGRGRNLVARPNVPLRAVARGFARRECGRVLRYVVAANAATYVASPFVTPFLLGQLELSYGAYMVLIASSFVAKIISLPRLGARARDGGGHQLLAAGAIGIAPLPILWFVSDSFAVLLLAHILTGVAWAAFELGMFLRFFEVTEERERTAMLSLFNGLNAAGIAVGSILGALVLYVFGGGFAGFVAVFLLSTVGRFAAIALLPPAEPGQPRIAALPALRILGVRPTVTVTRPVLGVDPLAEPGSARRARRYMRQNGARPATDRAAPAE